VSRLIAAAVLAVLWTAGTVAGEAAPIRAVDFNKPGALEALQRSNSTHYDKVRKILDGILKQPEAAVPRWIQTNFEAQDVIFRPFLLTTIKGGRKARR